MSSGPHPLHASPLRPCPYIEGRNECVIATELTGGDAKNLYHDGIRAGFRRSHNFMYRPACPGCNACRPVRVVTSAFTPSRSLDRVWRANRHVTAKTALPEATTEQYGLFARYQAERHPGGGMDRMSFIEYRAMVEESPVDTLATEFHDGEGELIAVMLADALPGALSAVYSFYDTEHGKLALGTYMILWLIAEAKSRDLDYVYLGYWISGCAKMDYKSRFRPLEAFGPQGWTPLESGRGAAFEEAV
jgi:arginine-tRNA-protein transferase